MKNLVLSFIHLLLFSQLSFAQPDIAWEQAYGGTHTDIAYSIAETSDGGYIIAGESTSDDIDASDRHGSHDALIVKIDNAGNIQWSHMYGGSDSDKARDIIETTDGGYIFTGETQSTDGDVSGAMGQEDLWVVKLTALGAIEWQRPYGGSRGEEGYSIIQTSDGGFAVAGISKSDDGDVTCEHGYIGDYWLLKLSESGSIEWQKTYGGVGLEKAESVKQTLEGGYILTGYATSTGGDVTGLNGALDYWVVKVSALGDITWEKTLGGTGVDSSEDVIVTSDGNYLVIGSTLSNNGDVSEPKGGYDSWIVKLNSSGTILWEKSFGGSGSEIAESIIETTDGGYIIGGSTNSTDGDISEFLDGGDCWLYKLTSSGELTWDASFGGNSGDNAYSTQLTSDGGCIMAGCTQSSDGDISNFHGLYDFWVVKTNPTGSFINEEKVSNPLTLYPNPAEHSVQLKNTSANSRTTFWIYNHSGQLVNQGQLNSENASIELDHLSPGAYVIKIQNKDGFFSTHLVKQ